MVLVKLTIYLQVFVYNDSFFQQKSNVINIHVSFNFFFFFSGLDGSAAFITGDFTDDGLTDDVSMLTNKQIQSLINWVEFYRKTYPYKGTYDKSFCSNIRKKPYFFAKGITFATKSFITQYVSLKNYILF